jgi:hypothetical protein
MTLRKFAQKTRHDYVQRVKHVASHLKRSPDTAKPEDIRGFQLHLTWISRRAPSGRSPEGGARGRRIPAYKQRGGSARFRRPQSRENAGALHPSTARRRFRRRSPPLARARRRRADWSHRGACVQPRGAPVEVQVQEGDAARVLGRSSPAARRIKSPAFPQPGSDTARPWPHPDCSLHTQLRYKVRM